MLRQAECERYRQWKKQQEALLKGPKRKPKKKTRKDRRDVTDCIEEEKKVKPKTVLKVQYRKCAQKETQKPKQGPTFKLKPVSSVELLFRRIQPSLEVRHKFLVQRHADCYAETVPEVDVEVLRKAALLETSSRIIKRKTKRKRSKRRKRDKEQIQKTEKEEGEMADEEESKETDAEAGEATEEDDAQAVEKPPVDETGDKEEVKRKKKDKFWCKKLKKRKIDSESEDSECESICSFDSNICLKGLALTAEEKKKIKENRRNIQASSAA